MQEKAQELRASGMSYRAIAGELGVSHPTIMMWCNPEYAAKKMGEKAERQKSEEGRRYFREYRRKNPQKKAYKRPSKEKMASDMALRRARKNRAMPPWLTADHKAQIEAVYAEAKELTRLTGIRHEVDHIHPINGKTVCGLHVPWNLQVLSKEENCRKNNKLTVK